MFSMRSFTLAAMRAISLTPSAVNSSVAPSDAHNAAYCLVSAFSGSVMIRRKSASVSDDSSTRIETALQLRDQIARLGDMERAGGDEQDMIGAHEAVARLHRGSLDDRQQI